MRQHSAAFWSSALLSALLAGLENKVLLSAKRCTGVSVRSAGYGMLTKWFSSTRLETRTKESNIYASIWVQNPGAQ